MLTAPIDYEDLQRCLNAASEDLSDDLFQCCRDKDHDGLMCVFTDRANEPGIREGYRHGGFF